MPDLTMTRVFRDNLAAVTGGKRRALNEGGTSSSKTFSVLQLLAILAAKDKQPTLTSVVSESLPHLKRGAIRDWFRIMGTDPDSDPNWSKTEFLYKVPGVGSCVEFFGADNADKVRGPRRHRLFINEGNNIPWDTARGLDIRTERFTFVDWNPVSQFWAHEHWVGQLENAFIHSTYLDARDVLPLEVVKNIESNKDKDPNWWNVYGLGLLGTLEHIIWPNFVIVDELPLRGDWKAWSYGADFGYVNPTSVLKVVLSNGELWWDECLYEARLTNSDLIERLSHIDIGNDRADIYCDNAEPGRIEEIVRAGHNALAANKDVKLGLDLVRRHKLHITKRSVATIKEVRNYCRKKDRDGHVLEEPVKINDHACDSGRYASMGLVERFGFATVTPGRVGNLAILQRWEEA